MSGKRCKAATAWNGTRPVLKRRVRSQEGAASMETCGIASRWACENSAIALSVHVKTTSKTVKALVLMALFGRNSADARITLLLLSTALRLSQTLESSLFRVGHGDSRNAVESKDARVTLWATFILDAELSLCCGLGSRLGAGRADIDLSNDEYPDDRVGEACARSIFRTAGRARLDSTRQSGRVSTRAMHSTLRKSQLLGSIVTLNQALEDWRQDLPPEAQPGHVKGTTLEPHCIILHLAFHNLPSMIHWAARRHSAGMLLVQEAAKGKNNPYR
ncbi:hypothetical protein B0H66DRAFT_632601 [Apodospora peruviana]|uniref:Transcription factor domain-containing protein n=1 Tax=Apodospora peruviana TaxID=516989 RepID=A0AAE0LY86_9PEZI|nr:hypothetical protein B0H66DRAFT_632601 [Apodospora peruviana]